MAASSLQEFQLEIGARMARGEWTAADAAAAGCRAAWPADSAGWLLGSIALLLADQKDMALALVEERLATDTKNVQCLLQKAECLLALGRRKDALSSAGEAALYAANAPALNAVGTFFVYSIERSLRARRTQISWASAPKYSAFWEISSSRRAITRLCLLYRP